SRAGVSNSDAELGQISRRDTSSIPRRGSGAPHFSLRKQRLKNQRRRESWGAPWNSGERHEHLRNLPETIDNAQTLDHVGNLRINWRVEDPIPSANRGLVVDRKSTRLNSSHRC